MKNDIQTILEIFYKEIVKEAREGCILVDDWQYHMRFLSRLLRSLMVQLLFYTFVMKQSFKNF